METDVRSTEILNSTPNEAVSLNCSGLASKMTVGELTSQRRSNQLESTNQVEWPTIQKKQRLLQKKFNNLLSRYLSSAIYLQKKR